MEEEEGESHAQGGDEPSGRGRFGPGGLWGDGGHGLQVARAERAGDSTGQLPVANTSDGGAVHHAADVPGLSDSAP
ncbi:hypothetical protein D187_007062 [Cystobacter fuscus DSM 2262]|uniref:Uncharacterized protein n=1 Tax=Cystobacter fuscus (strain ATCC 25194 / DSM 2262 / NBRC 100088 / M29) TaxID=1242864 RepID=S9QLD9_CYSF2|nr:hypothetical protein D187_007062 [Cystobacter fuscus DSM 2262]